MSSHIVMYLHLLSQNNGYIKMFLQILLVKGNFTLNLNSFHCTQLAPDEDIMLDGFSK